MRVCWLLLGVIASSVAAQTSEPALVSKPIGTIIMYRPSAIMGFGIACPVRYKGREIVELGRGKFAAWQVPAGRYILGNKTSSVEVAVDPGETRYVRCQMESGFMTARAGLQIVDEEAFALHKADYEEKVAAPFG